MFCFLAKNSVFYFTSFQLAKLRTQCRIIHNSAHLLSWKHSACYNYIWSIIEVDYLWNPQQIYGFHKIRWYSIGRSIQVQAIQVYYIFIEKNVEIKCQENDKGFLLLLTSKDKAVFFNYLCEKERLLQFSELNMYFSQSYCIRSYHKCYNKLLAMPCLHKECNIIHMNESISIIKPIYS